MSAAPLPRRDFLATSARALGAGVLVAELPWLASLAACARDDAGRGAPFTTFTAAEGRAFRAFAAQILPTDELPGAEEAGAVYFADRALGGPMARLLPVVRRGLAELDRRAAAAAPPAERFADLAGDAQQAVMRAVEQEERGRADARREQLGENPRGQQFFRAARSLVLLGTFSDPAHGGNRGGVGWALVHFDHRGLFHAPFGYYDAQAAGAPDGGVA